METKQIDEKGFVQELVANLRKEHEKQHGELQLLSEEFVQKAERIQFFERKLNKWIKLFEDSE